jgi:hypothetical protein
VQQVMRYSEDIVMQACKATAMTIILSAALPTLAAMAQAPSAAGPTAEKRPDFCTEQYEPVCGRLGEAYKIYSNACFARMAGASIVTDKTCPDDKSTPSPK